jgi:hypothetical protein
MDLPMATCNLPASSPTRAQDTCKPTYTTENIDNEEVKKKKK